MRKTTLAATVALGIATLSGAALLPSSAAAEAPSTTMKFVLHQTATHNLGKTSFGGTDVAKRGGNVIGFDAIAGAYNTKTQVVTINVAWEFKGGQITARVHSTTGTKFTGPITGGTGTYKGISGTVAAHSPTQNSKKTYVTLTYKH